MSLSVFLFACGKPNSILSYEISYIVDNQVYHESDIENGVIKQLPNDPVKTGYIFDGWFFDEGEWEEELTIQSLLNLPLSESRTISVYAKFTKYNCSMDNLSHQYRSVEEVEPTCATTGYRIYECSVCSALYRDYLPKLSHDLVYDIAVPARCGVNGIKHVTCSRSGCTYSSNVTLPALEHIISSSVTIQPNCVDKGEKLCVCTRDNCNYSYTEDVPELDHDYMGELISESTCENQGSTRYTCQREGCGDWYIGKYNALGHIFETSITIQPCVTPGLRVTTCQREGCQYSSNEVVDPLGYHDCNKDGNCVRCGSQGVCSPNFVVTGNTLTGYNGIETDVVIPSMFNGSVINSISSAFSNNGNITSVYIPDTVISIESMAFYCCSNLASVRIPQNLETIGIYAFSLTKITDIYIPKTVEIVSVGAFYYCEALESVYYEGSKTQWDAIQFENNNTEIVSANITYNYIRQE